MSLEEGQEQTQWRQTLILAQHAEVKGDFVEAEKHFKEALKLAEQAFGENHHNVVLSLTRLGELYRLKDDFKQAETCYRQAYDLASANHEDSVVKSQAAILAKLLVAQARIEEALVFDKAEEVYLDAAGLAVLAGDKEQAINYLDHGLTALKAAGSPDALHLLAYGRLLITTGQHGKAEEVLRSALAHEANTDPFLITSIVDGLARVLNEQSRADEANQLWEKYRHNLTIG